MLSKVLPDFCISGRPMESIDGVVIHYFSARNVDPENLFEMNVCRDLFIDLNLKKEDRVHYMKDDKWPGGRMYASAHMLIGRSGEVWKLVEFGNQAYHAGSSIMNGRSECNRWTLGIELVGSVDSGFTNDQYISLAEILTYLMEEYRFPFSNVCGHDLVRWNAIQKGSNKRPKYDPSGRKDGKGDNFDWSYLKSLVYRERA